MNDLIVRSKIFIFLSIVFVTIMAGFGIVIPMKTALEESVTQAFIQLADSKFYAIENTIARNVEGASSLSSRTMIQHAISDYKSGDITMDALKEYTQPKYEDGARVLKNLLLAQRCVEGTVVAEYGDPGAAQPFAGGAACSSEITRKIFISNGDTLLLQVLSPIKPGQDVLGVDRLVFSLSEEIRLMNDGLYRAAVMLSDDYENFVDSATLLTDTLQGALYQTDTETVCIIMLQDDTAFVVAAQTAKLYQTVTRLIWQAAVLWFVTFGLLIAASFFYIFRYAHNQLGQVAKSRDEYKSMAYLDKMTGAYSRMFLEVWDNEQRPQILISTLIIIDIDDFKQVNDKYGHLVGDKVIITVAEAAAASIRQNDHLIRFGGDEFLILLENAGAQDAQKVVSRMEAYIAEITAYPFRITFSYGIAALDRHESLHDKLQLADDRMYDAKNLKKRASAGTEGE